MKISKLKITNCLGIEELEIKPEKINIISGGNEQGKTSILECIEKGLINNERRAKFIKNGSEKAQLLVELDEELTINRRFNADGKGTVKISNNNMTVNKPEEYLKNLIGSKFNPFNPVDFMGEKDAKQTEMLLQMIQLNFAKDDFEQYFDDLPPLDYSQHVLKTFKQLEEHYYSKRTLANAEVEAAKNEIDALEKQLPCNYNAEDWRNINLSDLYRQVTDGQKVNNNLSNANKIIAEEAEAKEAIKNKYDLRIAEIDASTNGKIEVAIAELDKKKVEIGGKLAELRKQIADLEAELIVLDKRKELAAQGVRNAVQIERDGLIRTRDAEIETYSAKIEEARKYVGATKPFDVATLQEKAQEAEQMKNFISIADSAARLRKEYLSKCNKAKQLDECVKLSRSLPLDLIRRTELPINGLGINERNQITIDGLPLKNLSTSRQIGIVLEIARHFAGELKVICIDRFESFDSETREEFFRQAKNDGFQYFVTLVTEGALKVEGENEFKKRLDYEKYGDTNFELVM